MLTAGKIMDKSAALLNDTAGNIFTNTNQLPYLNMALSELQELFELHNIPVTSATSGAIQVNAGVTSIPFTSTTGGPTLPRDLIEIRLLWERLRDTNPYVQMTRVDYLPHYMEGVLATNFIWWSWQEQCIKLLESSQNNDLKLDYIKSLFVEIVNPDDPIDVINARSFLQYRTAALCAQFILQDKERSDDLNVMAQLSIDRALGINIKGGQAIRTRRRPFRAGMKVRSYI